MQQDHRYQSNDIGARYAVPTTHLLGVFDARLWLHVAADVYCSLKNHPVTGGKRIIHLMDVRNFLESELHAAYDFLAMPEHSDLWELCSPKNGLAEAVRSYDVQRISEIRDMFLGCIGICPENRLEQANTTHALAWAIIVEAALLNQRLIEDIAETSGTKGCPLSDARFLQFYHPQCDEKTREAFSQYVRCRWPIRVFALDPVTEQQNIADIFARRRELQIAMALAFASGRMNAQTLMRYIQRLEWDMATIDLNRTVVAFSHANDTFGWRFYPRFQTPPIESGLKRFTETLFGGPSDESDLRNRELEPGIRECTAIVIAPSFVPFITLDIRTRWFPLTHPRDTTPSIHQAMVLSRAIKSMQESTAQCAACAHLYRDGEVQRLLRRVAQLERGLPLQTLQVQIPFENTLGGFELFNTGTTDLAPELLGWYGAPGISCQNDTTIYLVGDGFSVHDTRVIAGGRGIPCTLISRQIIQATIPKNVELIREVPSNRDMNPRYFVDIHIATPYGVSGHMLIPAIDAESKNEDGLTWIGPTDLTVTANVSSTNEQPVSIIALSPNELRVRCPEDTLLPDKTTLFLRTCLHGLLLDLDSREIRWEQQGTTRIATIASDDLKDICCNLLQRIRPYLQHTCADESIHLNMEGKVMTKGGLSIPIKGVITVCISSERK